MIGTHAAQINASRVGEQNEDQRQLGDDVDRRMLYIDCSEAEPTGTCEKAERHEQEWRGKNRALEFPGHQSVCKEQAA